LWLLHVLVSTTRTYEIAEGTEGEWLARPRTQKVPIYREGIRLHCPASLFPARNVTLFNLGNGRIVKSGYVFGICKAN
jgi:hypothetical protein